jgi:enoyl-CoA hydratase/carnithine racemase
VSAILYEVADNIATITFNRPEKLNAFTRDMAVALAELIDRTDADDDVRAVIITGAGRAFCAGADLSAGDSSFANGAPETSEVPRDFGGLISLRFFASLKPIIVAFNGSAAGMGVTMALAADMRLAVPGAKFTLPFVRRGIVPESAAAWFLPRLVGLPQALEWTLTGRTFLADEALAGGLVRSLHEPADLLPAARALAAEITANGAPVSVALTRQMLWRMLGAAHPMEAHKIDSRGIDARARASDVKEGVASFLEKRPPHFTDRVSTDMPDFFPWWEDEAFS